MILDVRTIVVLLILGSVLMTLTLAVGIRSGRGHGFVQWNAGLGLFALGWILVAGRGTLPDVVTLALADALLLAGLCFQLAAIAEHGRKRTSRWLPTAPAALLFAVTLPLMHDYAWFTFVVSVAYAAAFSAIAIRAQGLGPSAGPARWMLAGSYLTAAVVLLGRALVLLADPQAHLGLFVQSAVHTAAFMVLFAVTATGSTAFLLMLRERAETELRHLAMFDPLTEIFNRRAFMQLAEREFARARRGGAPLAVLMLDLDHFKRVNDEFGHQAGDRVLVEFAAAAKACLRAEDLLGRYGGEEFCAILPGADRGIALAIAERIRAAVSAAPLGGLPRITTISVGAAVCGSDTGCDLDTAIACADRALYQAKRSGRDRVVAFPMALPAVASAAARRLAVAS